MKPNPTGGKPKPEPRSARNRSRIRTSERIRGPNLLIVFKPNEKAFNLIIYTTA